MLKNTFSGVDREIFQRRTGYERVAESSCRFAFLDIQMPELNGLEFSKLVNPATRIVFTTAFEQYAIDGYKVNALDYLLKPISYVDFLQAANKAMKWFELLQQPKEEIQSIFVKVIINWCRSN